MKEKYTPNAQRVLKVAYELSEQMGQGYIGTEHLLIALVRCDGVAKDILLKNGVKEEELLELAKKLIVLGVQKSWMEKIIFLRWQKKCFQIVCKRQIHMESVLQVPNIF